MAYRYNLKVQNKYGDNGWWKKTGDTIGHYFHIKLPLCGTNKFNDGRTNLMIKDRFDRCCKNCSKVRRNQLRARMNASSSALLALRNSQVFPKSHSPRKPQ